MKTFIQYWLASLRDEPVDVPLGYFVLMAFVLPMVLVVGVCLLMQWLIG